VKVACVGAGPAGLFFALLLCRAGGHEVEVFERAEPDAAFGFGVVFSRLSLARLRRVAPDAVDELLEHGATWDGLQVRRRGERVRSAGHGFAAVERRALLAALRRPAEAAGARLRFHTEADAAGLLDRYDLVVAADGANSRTRGAAADPFGARVDAGASRYAWFASDRVFEEMTFLFAESEYGPVAAHAYPYCADRGTFLLEIDARTWQRAGFADGHAQTADWSDERAMDFAHRVFADELGGARLYGNGSRWLRFPLVKCARWHDGNLVGVGDAVHTAHFSVGSGTTMALEDAAELARCLTELGTGDGDIAGGDVTDGGAPEQALAAFESVRRPAVDSLQAAAWASRRVWEHPETYRSADLGTLMLRMLSRTGQLSARQLLRLDPNLPGPAGEALTAFPRHDAPTLTGLKSSSGAVLLDMSPDSDCAQLAQQFAALRTAHPGAEVGLLVTAPGCDESAVRRRAEQAAGLVRRLRPDLLVVAPGTACAAENRTAQMVLAESMRGGTGPRVVYTCRPRELEHGWTHVQARRADDVWVLTD
jgi:2-polyprenyl-6-methoxyphenol hydroxylase-like FAD-dependent oxidoreductase